MRHLNEGSRPVDVVVSPVRPTLLIGTFDGVHRRTTEFIEHALASKQNEHPTVAVAVYVIGASHLTSVERTCELLVHQGVDTARALTIDTTSGLETLRRLIAELRPTSARVDPDLEPDVELLVRVALAREGIPLHRPATTSLDTGPASMIRRAVSIGDIALANRWLGRPHRLPVALQPTRSGGLIAECLDPEAQRPMSGTYIADVRVGRQRHRGALTIVGADRFALSFIGSAPRPDVATASIDFIDRADTGTAEPDPTCVIGR